jgi:uncharacterized repeat protein (TIGR01451 family)/fimbrial isopeptide formation D2 family protein
MRSQIDTGSARRKFSLAAAVFGATLLWLCGAVGTAAAAPSISVAKTTDSPTWPLGLNVGTYTITVTNNGTTATSGAITVTDTLPAGITVDGPNPHGGGFTCTVTGGNQLTCTWPTSNLNVGQNQHFPINVDVAAGTLGSVTNTASAYGGGDPVHTSGNPATGSNTQTILLPSLSVSKTAINTPWTLGQGNAQYKITVTNTGAGATYGAVTVTDTLPADLTANGAPNPGGGNTCTVTGGTQISCTMNTAINAGANATITIPVNLNTGTPASVTNTASAYGGGDPVHTAPGNAATGSVTTAVGVNVATNLALGPEQHATATGSYDGVITANNMNDFSAVNVQRGGTTTLTNPDGSGTGMSATLSASTAPCIAHTFAITTGGAQQISVSAVAPSAMLVGLYSNSLCTTLYSGSVVGNTSTGAIGNITTTAEVYVQYTTSGSISIVPFQPYDAILYAFVTGHLGDQGSNTTHDELYYGFVPVVKTQTILTSTCPGGTGLCPGSVLKYTLTYSSSLPAGYSTTEGALSPRPFPYAVPLKLNEDGTTAGSWGVVGGLTAAPTDTTAGTTYTYTINGVSTGNPVGATQFTATVGGAGYGGLVPAGSGTITFTVTVR